MDVEGGRVVADIDKGYDQGESAVLVEITLDQLGPAPLFRFGHLRIPVSGQIDEIDAVDVVEVDGRGFAGRLGHLGKPLAEHDLVENR